MGGTSATSGTGAGVAGCFPCAFSDTGAGVAGCFPCAFSDTGAGVGPRAFFDVDSGADCARCLPCALSDIGVGSKGENKGDNVGEFAPCTP